MLSAGVSSASLVVFLIYLGGPDVDFSGDRGGGASGLIASRRLPGAFA